VEAILIALATVFNIMIIKWKLGKKRYEDAAFDFTILLILAMLFSGSLGGLVIATITSFFVSLYLILSPPTFLSTIDSSKLLDEWKKRLPQ